MKRKLLGMILTVAMAATLITGCGTLPDEVVEEETGPATEVEETEGTEASEEAGADTQEVVSEGEKNTAAFDDYARPVIKE